MPIPTPTPRITTLARALPTSPGGVSRKSQSVKSATLLRRPTAIDAAKASDQIADARMDGVSRAPDTTSAATKRITAELVPASASATYVEIDTTSVQTANAPGSRAADHRGYGENRERGDRKPQEVGEPV